MEKNKNYLNIDQAKIIDLYQNKNYSMKKIANLFGCSYVTIYNRLKECGVKRNNKSRSISKKGVKNPAWISGSLYRGGYLFVKADNHPHKNNKGYVAQHRLVAEQKLGRYLVEGEIAHHLDNDKVNNSIDNIHVFNNISEHNTYHQFLNRIVKEELNGN